MPTRTESSYFWRHLGILLPSERRSRVLNHPACIKDESGHGYSTRGEDNKTVVPLSIARRMPVTQDVALENGASKET